ncbi:MAG: urease accessory protein UreE [Beijerinckiaceae bacterium]|jgi:urease accessory protein|nr:urease accessory protein UreE [Beijerinckiaceae bacterium]
MQRATSIVRKPAVKADKVIDTVVLAHEDRMRRRAVLKTLQGSEILLDLDKAGVLSEGDALKMDDGGLVLVKAAAQDLIEVRAENPLRLMRVAWHIGNRHTPAEITADALYIEDDHVLAEMIRGQGCSTTKVSRPFKPERGAYDHAGHDHGHAHDHHHDHEHGHHHDHHAKAHVNPPHGQPGHVHGPDCNHDHSHDHTHDVLQVGSHDHKHDHDHKHHHGHDHGHAPRAKHDH